MNFGLWICSHVAQVISLKRFPHPARPLPIGNFVHTRGSRVTNDEAAVRFNKPFCSRPPTFSHRRLSVEYSECLLQAGDGKDSAGVSWTS